MRVCAVFLEENYSDLSFKTQATQLQLAVKFEPIGTYQKINQLAPTVPHSMGPIHTILISIFY